VASLSSGKDLPGVIGESNPDVIILGDGIDAAELREHFPKTGMLVLSSEVSANYAQKLFDIVDVGIGYLLKSSIRDGTDLVDALIRIGPGESMLDQKAVVGLIGGSKYPSGIEGLNGTELAVLRLMAEGHSNYGISKQTAWSPRTVEAHVTRIFTKLGLDQSDTANNRVRAVLAFVRSNNG
jgi:DNA-binding NarL/FixJ family response regulator